MLLNIFFQKEEAVAASTKMSQDFILVCGEEGGEPCEVVSTLIHHHLNCILLPSQKLCFHQVQVEPDGSVELDSIQAQFPGITGIKYRNPATQVC